MLWLIPIAIGGYILLKEKETMSNLNAQFKNFESKISLTETQTKNIVNRHNTIRELIENYFKNKEGFKTPSFFIQGSYKMKTMVQKVDGSYDVDLGVYFDTKPSVTCTKMQEYVKDAVNKQTSEGAQHLKKCVRLNYKGEFNIDLPVYYQLNSYSHAKLAIKNEDWRTDDPEEFIKWFESQRKIKEINKDGQMLRVVKYLKYWLNQLSFKTPSGMAITIWVGNYFIAVKDRDDEALYKTLENIYNNNSLWLTCKCPVEPFDNVISNLDEFQKTKFINELKAFKVDAYSALYSVYNDIAVTLWNRHLGNKFTL